MARRKREPKSPKPVNLCVQVAIVPRGMVSPKFGLTLLVTPEVADELKLSNGEHRIAYGQAVIRTLANINVEAGAITLLRPVDAR